MSLDFKNFGKIPRWVNEHVWISEKLDGSNSCVVIEKLTTAETVEFWGQNIPNAVKFLYFEDEAYVVRAQSRNKFITPGKGTDNFGFAGWVHDNASALVEVLGAGYSYGEYYGSGIQSGYGLLNGEKHFALFPTHRISRLSDNFEQIMSIPGLEVAPELYEGPFGEGNCIEDCLNILRDNGSFAHSARGFARPEGVVVQFKLSGARYKAFVVEDGPKTLKEGRV